MIHCYGSVGTTLALSLVLNLSVAQPPGTALPPLSAETDWADRIGVLHAVDPDEAALRQQFPDDSDQPILRNREAVLHNPASGRDLVGLAVAEEARGQPIALPTQPTSRPERVFQRQRLAAPNFVVPVVRGK